MRNALTMAKASSDLPMTTISTVTYIRSGR
jgi:hypothetical protein